MKKLITAYASIDETTLDDVFLAVASTIEDSLIQAGATPVKDYTIIDLYKLAQPFVEIMFKEKDLSFTSGYPS